MEDQLPNIWSNFLSKERSGQDQDPQVILATGATMWRDMRSTDGRHLGNIVQAADSSGGSGRGRRVVGSAGFGDFLSAPLFLV